MGRRSGGGGRRPAPRPRAPPPRPAAAGAPPPAMQQQQSGGSMTGGLMGMVAQGMAWGTGSSIARHTVGAVMGGGGGHEAAPAAAPAEAAATNPCANQMKAFSACINENSGDIAKCQVYVDMLNACKRGDLA